ncbi:MAG: metalloregulator ArsR/SmtB family transcription factor [Desulfoarculaceae bacterium]|nr:metalloregulator ArsR/SmtB family transcription factor [Desulfoarculaceae bacterium]
MKDFIKVMKALSDPNRVKIVNMLQQRNSLCVCEIRAILKLAQPTVSKHLKVLEEAGLIVSEKDKLWVNYRLHLDGDSPYGTAMLELLENLLNETPELVEIHRLLPTINRYDICKS